MHKVSWRIITLFFLCISLFLVGDIDVVYPSSQLVNQNLLGREARTIEEVLTLPEDEIDLATAVLLLVKEAYRELYHISIDIDWYLNYIDEISLELQEKIKNTSDPEKIIAIMNHYFFEKLRLVAMNDETSRRGFLNVLLKEGKGNCLSLSLLYLTVAERIGIPLYGVFVPTHIFVRFDNSQKRINIETTTSGTSLPNSFYEKEYSLWSENRFYLRNLGKREVIGIVYYSIGVAYHERGLFEKAADEYNKAVELNPEFADAYNTRGAAYTDQGLYARALIDYNRALQLNPRLFEVYQNRGNVYYAWELYTKAIEDYSKALELSPPKSSFKAIIYCSRGNAYQEQGMPEKARQDYSKAIELDPQCSLAYYNRGISQYLQDFFDQAIADFSKALEINPRYTEAYYRRGNAYFQQLHLNEAIADYTKTVELDTQYVLAYLCRGTAYYLKGLIVQIIDFLLESIGIDIQDIITTGEGFTSHAQDFLNWAVSDFDEVLNIDPENAWAYLLKANVYEMEGLSQKAIEAYRAFIRYAPQDASSQIEEIREKLKSLETTGQ